MIGGKKRLRRPAAKRSVYAQEGGELLSEGIGHDLATFSVRVAAVESMSRILLSGKVRGEVEESCSQLLAKSRQPPCFHDSPPAEP